MKARSAKAKGRRAEIEFASLIRELTGREAKRQLLSGASYLKGDINSNMNICWEVKNQESLNIWNSLKQAEREATNFEEPILAFKRNNTKFYCAMDAEYFLKLWKKAHDKTEDPDRDLKYSLTRLKNAINSVLSKLK